MKLLHVTDLHGDIQKYDAVLQKAHESSFITGVWKAQIGNTICVQPGQGIECPAVIIDLQSMKMERLVLK